MTSVFSAVRNWIAGYQELPEDAPVWVNFLGEDPRQFSVMSVPGKTATEDIIGNKTIEYPFAFGSTESTAENIERLSSVEFYEAFSEWLEEQTEAGNFPDLGTNRTVERIEALDLATIIERTTDTGVYQILCKLIYQEERRN